MRARRSASLSGKGNVGTISGATWTTAGHSGGALSLNGSSSWVTVPDSNSLDLTNGMTLEAWVKPSALGTSWRTVIFKETAGGIVYNLYATQSSGVPVTQTYTGGEDDAPGTTSLPMNAWVHLAATYDGSNLRLYSNGTLVRTTPASGSMAASTGLAPRRQFRSRSEWFSGPRSTTPACTTADCPPASCKPT